MLNIRAIQTFVAIVDAGSLTKAASLLGTSQPAVSMALRQLETTLGTTLLDRTVRPPRLTHGGFALYHRAAAVVSDVAGLHALVAGACADKVERLRIGLMIPFSSTLVTRLQQIARDIEVRSGLTPDLIGALLARDLDIVVTSSPVIQSNGLDRVQIVSEPFVAVLPAAHANTPSWPTIERVAEALPFVRYTARAAIAGTIERILRRRRIDTPDRFEFDTSQSVLTTVAAGIGWTITTPICIAQSRCGDDVLRVLPVDDLARRRLFIVHRRDEFESSAERMRAYVATYLIERVKATFARTSPWVVDAMRLGPDEDQL